MAAIPSTSYLLRSNRLYVERLTLRPGFELLRKTTAMHHISNDLAETLRSDVIGLLQARLADTLDLKMQMKQAHWNVKGPNFIALHELFDQLHTEMDGFADILAERLVALGGQALGTVDEVKSRSSLQAYPAQASATEEHLAALALSLSTLGRLVRTDIDTSADLGDQASSDVFTEVSRGVDKALWFVESHV